jgi:pyridoxal 5'-phosphate synthase pdxS subunit
MEDKTTGTLTLKTGLAEMLKGGVIMDVTNPAGIAEDAGAVAIRARSRRHPARRRCRADG